MVCLTVALVNLAPEDKGEIRVSKFDDPPFRIYGHLYIEYVKYRIDFG
jgi:hypothetical protein